MAKIDESGKRKGAVGGLVGRSIGGKIVDCHADGNIIIKGKPKDANVGGLVGQSENTEIVNSSADVKVEFENETNRSEPIIELKPNFYGIGVNLRALFKKVRAFFFQGSHSK